MKSSSPSARAKERRTLRLFLYGPGVGESIIMRLPCGNWGVVDCYQRQKGASEGTLAFLQRNGVDRLAFFCHTHPHEDHYLGADLLFQHYAGKIDRIWRHPGFSSLDITTRAVLAATIEARKLGNPEPVEAAEGYCKLLAAIRTEKEAIKKRAPDLLKYNYRRISGPTDVMEGDDYRIQTLAPSAEELDGAEAHLATLRADLGYSAFSDDSGSFLNGLSVVLHITFRKAEILLLADAQGASQHAHHAIRKLTVVKIAHHGSKNGTCAALITKTPASTYKVPHGILTPYTRSGLPDAAMVANYQRACKNFTMTEKSSIQHPNIAVLGMPGAVPVHRDCEWVGLEILPSGKVRPCNGVASASMRGQ